MGSRVAKALLSLIASVAVLYGCSGESLEPGESISGDLKKANIKPASGGQKEGPSTKVNASNSK